MSLKYSILKDKNKKISLKIKIPGLNGFKYQIQCLDNVQNHFLRFMAFKCVINRIEA